MQAVALQRLDDRTKGGLHFIQRLQEVGHGDLKNAGEQGNMINNENANSSWSLMRKGRGWWCAGLGQPTSREQIVCRSAAAQLLAPATHLDGLLINGLAEVRHIHLQQRKSAMKQSISSEAK